ncbi:MAG: DUF494 family protein [Gammaproteobacteria bacterium]|jgi:Smg protein
MKENVLDVLMYLFENYMDDESEVQPDRDMLMIELQEAGFPSREIGKAFAWLEALAQAEPEANAAPEDTGSLRIFAPLEIHRLDAECRGFLMYLEQIGILNPVQRELVIDRIMALETDEIDLEQVKWIILMVLFNQPGQEAEYARMEDLVFDEKVGLVH